jgi:hypothetical protein
MSSLCAKLEINNKKENSRCKDLLGSHEGYELVRGEYDYLVGVIVRSYKLNPDEDIFLVESSLYDEFLLARF